MSGYVMQVGGEDVETQFKYTEVRPVCCRSVICPETLATLLSVSYLFAEIGSLRAKWKGSRLESMFFLFCSCLPGDAFFSFTGTHSPCTCCVGLNRERYSLHHTNDIIGEARLYVRLPLATRFDLSVVFPRCIFVRMMLCTRC